MRMGLLNHDPDLAMKYIDADSVVNHLVEETLAKCEKGADTPFERFGAKVGKGAARFMMPAIQNIAREGLRAAIASEEPDLFREVRDVSVWYFSIRNEGETALVKPRFKSDTHFRMDRASDGHWRIVEIIDGPQKGK